MLDIQERVVRTEPWHFSMSCMPIGHRLFICKLETDNFVFFSSRFICSKTCRFVLSARLFSSQSTSSTNMSNQSNRLRETAKKLRKPFLQTSALFFLTSVSISSLLNKVSMVWPCHKQLVVNSKWLQ